MRFWFIEDTNIYWGIKFWSDSPRNIHSNGSKLLHVNFIFFFSFRFEIDGWFGESLRLMLCKFFYHVLFLFINC